MTSVFGWDSSTSVTREVKYDSALDALLFYPVEEIANLRSATPVCKRSGVLVPTIDDAHKTPPLTVSASPGAAFVRGSALDIEITFSNVPKQNGLLVLSIRRR